MIIILNLTLTTYVNNQITVILYRKLASCKIGVTVN